MEGIVIGIMAPAKKKSAPMSDEHKAALAEGRTQGRAIRQYLDALETQRPKRGRKRTPESMKKRLDALDAQIAEADPLKRVQLIQERMDLERELEAAQGGVDLDELEQGFIAAAAPYSQRKGLSYAAWRELGVPTNVLTAAGIRRGS